MDDLAIRRETPPPALALGAAGAIPFVLAALSQWMTMPLISSEFGYRAGVIYAAIILSFLGGVRWGAILHWPQGERQTWDLAGSNIAALAGWLALLLPPVMCLSLLIAGFLLQGLWDLIASEQGLLPHWFGRLRTALTAVVCVSLGLMLLKAAVS
jgi:Protein of unknown function (DUF3429)